MQAALRFLFWPALAFSYDPTCWLGAPQGWQHDDCCGERFGPQGNLQCWDMHFTAERCCKSEAALTVPGIDCWGGEFTAERCCDQSKGAQGDASCWIPPFSFALCCGSIARQAGVLLTTTPAPVIHKKAAEVSAPTLSCWDSEFTESRCCDTRKGPQGDTSCWTAAVSFALCCPPGLKSTAMDGTVYPLTDPLAKCMVETGTGEGILHRQKRYKPASCAQTVYYVGQATSPPQKQSRVGHDSFPFRWQLSAPSSTSNHRLQGLSTSFAGALCLPSACNISAAARFFAPHLLNPHLQALPLRWQMVNASHVEIARPMAARHAASGARPETWLAENERLFQIQEYHPWWSLGDWNWRALATSVLVLLATSVISCALPTPSKLPRFVQIQESWSLLFQPRDLLHVDVFKAILWLVLLHIHALDYFHWHDRPSWWVSGVRYLMSGIKSNIGIAFVVLTVHLRMERSYREQQSPRWFRPLASIFTKWLWLAPPLGFFTYLYVNVFVEELPVNNVFKVPSLHQWFGEQRDMCSQPWHLWTSYFMVHDIVFQCASPCHYVSAFEAIFYFDAILVCLLSLLGNALTWSCLLCMWVLILSATQAGGFNPSQRQALLPSLHGLRAETWESLAPTACAAAVLVGILQGVRPWAGRRGGFTRCILATPALLLMAMIIKQSSDSAAQGGAADRGPPMPWLNAFALLQITRQVPFTAAVAWILRLAAGGGQPPNASSSPRASRELLRTPNTPDSMQREKQEKLKPASPSDAASQQRQKQKFEKPSPASPSASAAASQKQKQKQRPSSKQKQVGVAEEDVQLPEKQSAAPEEGETMYFNIADQDQDPASRSSTKESNRTASKDLPTVTTEEEIDGDLLSAAASVGRLSGSMNISHIFFLHFASGFCNEFPLEENMVSYCGVVVITAVASFVLSMAFFLCCHGPLLLLVRGLSA